MEWLPPPRPRRNQDAFDGSLKPVAFTGSMSNCWASPRAFLRTNGRNALDIARGFDRQVAEFQVRVAVLNGFTALGTPVTEVAG